jgi:hypothetical protein
MVPKKKEKYNKYMKYKRKIEGTIFDDKRSFGYRGDLQGPFSWLADMGLRGLSNYLRG